MSHTYTKRGLQEIVQQRWVGADLAAFALSEIEERERAEAERDQARRELEKALAEQKVEWENQIALERKKLASDPVYAEKAIIFELRRELAEERDKWTSYFGASAQNFLEQEEKTERRHRREVLSAKIVELENFGQHDTYNRTIDMADHAKGCRYCIRRLALLAELAALDAGEEAKL